MTKKEIEEINMHHIQGKDKWLRMFYGVQSDLIRYEDCIAHIVLKTTEEAEKAIVSKTVGIWQSEFERSMSDIKGYVIYHYQTKRSTGFIAPVLGLKRSLINKEVNSMKVPEKLVLLGISSGLIELTKC